MREDRHTDEGIEAAEAGLQSAVGRTPIAGRRCRCALQASPRGRPLDSHAAVDGNAVWLLAREAELLTLLLPSTQIESYGGEVSVLGNRGATTQSLDVQPRNDAG